MQKLGQCLTTVYEIIAESQTCGTVIRLRKVCTHNTNTVLWVSNAHGNVRCVHKTPAAQQVCLCVLWRSFCTDDDVVRCHALCVWHEKSAFQCGGTALWLQDAHVNWLPAAVLTVKCTHNQQLRIPSCMHTTPVCLMIAPVCVMRFMIMGAANLLQCKFKTRMLRALLLVCIFHFLHMHLQPAARMHAAYAKCLCVWLQWAGKRCNNHMLSVSRLSLWSALNAHETHTSMCT